MSGKHYRNEDDQILINMARKGASNAQIAAALNRSLRSVENRRSRLHAEGADFPRMPRTRRKKAERPTQVCFEVPEAAAQTVAVIGPPAGPIVPDGGADPIKRIAEQIDLLTEREEWLNGQLASLGAEKKKLLEQLTPLVNALIGVDLDDLPY